MEKEVLKMEYKSLKTVLVVFVISFLMTLQPVAAENRLKSGMKLPNITLEGIDCTNQASYLGVENHDLDLELSEIPANIIVLEFFAITCPVCQAQAPVANKIYKIIQRNPDLKKDVKMFAVGVGNQQNEVEAYRKQHGVKFPLFIDPYGKSRSRYGISQIPYTMVINSDREVLYTHLGVIEDLDEFMEKLNAFLK